MRLRNVSFLTVLLFGLCGLVSVSWYTAFSSSRGDVVDIYQREFLALRERLHSAEQENLRRSKELNLVLEEIKRAIAEKQALRDINRTWSSLSGADQQYASSVADNLKRIFPVEIQSGLLEVVSPSVHFYPDFSRLRESFGDPKERVRWRTKQNLDYCFLMMYAQTKGTYYVQLEDDIVARPNFFTTMKNFALQQPSEEWMILEFSQLGFIVVGRLDLKFSEEQANVAAARLAAAQRRPVFDHVMTEVSAEVVRSCSLFSSIGG
nr:PREDICTED: alpha-1,3-mannosyl-glycoprotein 4-beta-N-acetylglucosaminyltransferase B-like [Paralichthys olivaceus]